MENEYKATYYTDSNGTIRRTEPKDRMSKKERIRQRWEGKERFQTGRGNRAADHQLVIDYLRQIHPKTARKIAIAEATGINQARVLIILNNLSGLKDDYKDGIEGAEFPFLVYETGTERNTEYGIYKDAEGGIFPRGTLQEGRH
jgi:hypothetical protein